MLTVTARRLSSILNTVGTLPFGDTPEYLQQAPGQDERLQHLRRREARLAADAQRLAATSMNPSSLQNATHARHSERAAAAYAQAQRRLEAARRAVAEAEADGRFMSASQLRSAAAHRQHHHTPNALPHSGTLLPSSLAPVAPASTTATHLVPAACRLQQALLAGPDPNTDTPVCTSFPPSASVFLSSAPRRPLVPPPHSGPSVSSAVPSNANYVQTLLRAFEDDWRRQDDQPTTPSDKRRHHHNQNTHTGAGVGSSPTLQRSLALAKTNSGPRRAATALLEDEAGPRDAASRANSSSSLEGEGDDDFVDDDGHRAALAAVVRSEDVNLVASSNDALAAQREGAPLIATTPLPPARPHKVSHDIIDLVTDEYAAERKAEVARRRRVLFELTHPIASDYTFGGKLVPPPPLAFGKVTPEATALGRRMMTEAPYRLVRSAQSSDYFFEINDLYMEIVMIGRANAGKSSLINALLQQPVAKTSSTPNSTRGVNFYQSATPEEIKRFVGRDPSKLVKLPAGGLQLTFVDLPGFGITGMSERWRDNAIEATDAYLGVRRSVNTVFMCVDATKGLTHIDKRYFKWIENLHGTFYVVLTKCEAVSHRKLCELMREIYQLITDVSRGEDKFKAVFPFIIPVSAHTSENIDLLRGLIVETAGLIPGQRLREMLQKKLKERNAIAAAAEARRIEAVRRAELTASSADQMSLPPSAPGGHTADGAHNSAHNSAMCDSEEEPHHVALNMRRFRERLGAEGAVTKGWMDVGADPNGSHHPNMDSNGGSSRRIRYNLGLQEEDADEVLTIPVGGSSSKSRSAKGGQHAHALEGDEEKDGGAGVAPLPSRPARGSVIGLEPPSSADEDLPPMPGSAGGAGGTSPVSAFLDGLERFGDRWRRGQEEAAARSVVRGNDHTTNTNNTSRRVCAVGPQDEAMPRWQVERLQEVRTAFHRAPLLVELPTTSTSTSNNASGSSSARPSKRTQMKRLLAKKGGPRRKASAGQQNTHQPYTTGHRSGTSGGEGLVHPFVNGRIVSKATAALDGDGRCVTDRGQRDATLLAKEAARVNPSAPWRTESLLGLSNNGGTAGSGGPDGQDAKKGRHALQESTQALWEEEMARRHHPETVREMQRRLRQEHNIHMSGGEVASYRQVAGKIVNDFKRFEGEVKMHMHRPGAQKEVESAYGRQRHQLAAESRINFRSQPVGLWRKYGRQKSFWQTPSVKGAETKK